MSRGVVLGGGTAGLAAALALSRAGHEVTLVERDAAAPPAAPEQAFAGWHRPGVPQLGHSHAFLARLHQLLLARAPDVRDALIAHGARELRFLDQLPPGLEDAEPAPGDDELVLLACRRAVFEWVLRRVVAGEAGVTWRGGLRATGLVADADGSGPPRVRGARVRGPAGEETLPADWVVDASGRGSPLPAWLARHGVRVPEEEEETGIVYFSRFFRLRDGAAAPEGLGLVGADLGYMKYGIFPGDRDFFSLTLAVPSDDAELGWLRQPGAFARASEAIPAAREWTEPARAVPISRVRGMAGLRNRCRRLVEDGRPLALGVHAIGDAAVCTNPLYGRGCALAFVHAFLLADALAAHRDPGDRALALDEATRRELEPWYRAARDQDRDGIAAAAALRRGEDPFETNRPDGSVDPRAAMRSILRDGFLPLVRTDIDALRAFVRAFNLVDPPDAPMRNAALLPRVLAEHARRHAREEVFLGPPRDEMLEALRRGTFSPGGGPPIPPA